MNLQWCIEIEVAEIWDTNRLKSGGGDVLLATASSHSLLQQVCKLTGLLPISKAVDDFNMMQIWSWDFL